MTYPGRAPVARSVEGHGLPPWNSRFAAELLDRCAFDKCKAEDRELSLPNAGPRAAQRWQYSGEYPCRGRDRIAYAFIRTHPYRVWLGSGPAAAYSSLYFAILSAVNPGNSRIVLSSFDIRSS